MKEFPAILYLVIGFNLLRCVTGILSGSSFVWLNVLALAILVFASIKKKKEYLRIFVIFVAADIILTTVMLTYLSMREGENWILFLQPGLWLIFGLNALMILLCFHRTVLVYFNLTPYNKTRDQIASSRAAHD